MNRRLFLAALLAGAAELPRRRTYSFLWTPPEPKVDVFTVDDIRAAVATLERYNSQPRGGLYFF